MDARIRRLISDLLANNVSKKEFTSKYPGGFDPTHTPVNLLEQALATKDTELVKWAMPLSFVFGITPNLRNVFKALALEDWHESHEDIAFELGRTLRDDNNVDALYHMATTDYPYLRFDKSKALSTKCIWSLGHIGTPKAINMLRCLALLDNPIIQKNALEQLKKRGE